MPPTVAIERRPKDEPLPNPRRGCGTLKPGKAYLIGAGFSPGGVLPSWVELDPPVPYREIGTEGAFTRGFEKIDGLTLQLALESTGRRQVGGEDGAGITRCVPHYPDELLGKDREALHDSAGENHVEHGVYDDADAVPDRESARHLDRVRYRGVEDGSHWGDIPVCGQTDVLMRAGASHYPDPVDYVVEAIEHGLSKAIPVTPNRDPPVIVSGVTRCWIMHPKACEGYGGGLIGYSYLSEVAFTEPEDGGLPGYVEEAAGAGKLTVRAIAEPPEEPDDDDEEDQASVYDFEPGDDDDEEEDEDDEGGGDDG